MASQPLTIKTCFMRSFFTLLFLVGITSTSFSQRWKMTAGYNLGLPQQEMNKNINPVHTLQAGALYQLAGTLTRMSVGLEAGIGIYAMERIDQTFTFDNSTTAVIPINYNSNALNANAIVRYDFADQKKFVIPYITAKGGVYNLHSNIYVENPHGAGCEALQSENIIKDATLTWGAGAGVQLNTAIFSKRKFHRNVKLDISANLVRGGNLKYINTKNLIDAQSLNDPEGKPLQVQFINASTQNIHEHTVAQVYNSALRLLEVRVGVVVDIVR